VGKESSNATATPAPAHFCACHRITSIPVLNRRISSVFHEHLCAFLAGLPNTIGSVGNMLRCANAFLYPNDGDVQRGIAEPVLRIHIGAFLEEQAVKRLNQDLARSRRLTV